MEKIIGYRSKYSEWIFNTETNKLRCRGDTSYKQMYGCIYGISIPSPHFLWEETDGFFIGFENERRMFIWFEIEKKEALEKINAFYISKRTGSIDKYVEVIE